MAAQRLTSMPFRPEIDGLRALAVMAVLLFHVDLHWVPGGFVGVDIFFVISGYLITRNILSAIDAGTFSLKQFYVRRFRRLYPALLATVSVSTVLAVLIFAPEHLARFGLEVVSSVFSFSNLFFWSESGYFDLDGTFKPLLHTWSLSVEEQFYLFWPGLMMLVSGLAARSRLMLVIGLGLLSLLAAEYAIHTERASLAFYWLPFRIVEFVAGAALVLLNTERCRGRSWLSAAGLVAMLLPIALFTGQTPFPGLSALLPSVGAALVIAAGSTAVTRPLLENRSALFLGKISYSVYLVHWPLVVFWAYLHPGPLSAMAATGIVLASVVLGYASWRWVEQPFRHGGQAGSRLRVGQVVPLLLGLSLVGATAAKVTDGRIIPREFALTASEIADGRHRRFDLVSTGCDVLHLDDAARCKLVATEQVLVFGNSHEPDGYNLWHSAFARDGLNLIAFGSTNRCEEFIRDPATTLPDTRDCRQRLAVMTDPDFVRSLDKIIYSANKPYSVNKDPHYDLLLDMLQIKPDIQVVILGGYFNLEKDCSYYMGLFNDTAACLRPEFVTYDREQEAREEQIWLQRDYAAKLKPLIISKFDLACDETCLAAAGGEPFAYDQHHLSLQFARALGERLKAQGLPTTNED